MIAWMLYATVVGLCAVAAARAAESLARMRRWSIRFAWIGAAAFSVALAAIAPFRTRAAPPDSGQRVNPSSLALVQTSIESVEQRVPATAVWYVVGLWGLSTILVTSAFAIVYGRLRRTRRTWPAVELEGHRVRVSPAMGPVVIGVVHPEIIVPRWVLSRSTDEQRIILAHEAAHVDAGDPLVLGLACALVALMPWNAALWIILSRVRLAIEVDCDARVLRGGVSPRSYGSLLVDVAESASPVRFAATALSDDSSHLHQRIRAMQPRRFGHPVLRGASAVLVAFAGLLVACEAKVPTAADIDHMDARSAEQNVRALGIRGDSLVWLVDGVVTSAIAARQIPSDSIVSIDVTKADGRTRLYVTTKHDQVVRAAAGSETLLAEHGRGARGGSGDPAAFGRVLQSAGGSTAQPILLVDGVRSDLSALKTIDRTRIEKVEILKGPLAMETYGADAKNGVIVMTMKPLGAP